MDNAPGCSGFATRDALYEQAAHEYGAALQRLARAYEADADRRQDLLQDIHIALWRSLSTFDGRCSLRTWVYRVAHNVATSAVIRRRAHSPTWLTLDEIASPPDAYDGERAFNRQHALDRLYALIYTLKPADRQVILMYLEGLDAASIGEISGMSPGNVATKVHRIKQVLARRFRAGETS
jgi:RNA polymerase sigma-70 factor (ECF subfamily)